jgi:CubicO group peptidase (beta-lactamase class C family)
MCILAATTAVAQNSEYETRYADQMGTRAPDVPHLNKAVSTIEAGAVYANRHTAEFPVVAWNFAPSSTPLRFNEDIKPLSKDVMEHLLSTNTDAYIVVKQGVIIHEYYGTGMHPTTRHAVFSAGKSWTSAAWHEQTALVMEKTVEEVMPELKGSYIGAQTIRHLVDMRVPINWGIDYSDPDSTINQFGGVMGWEFKSIGDTTMQFFKDLTRDPNVKAASPEERGFRYVDGNTALVGVMGPRVGKVHAYEGLRTFYEMLGTEYICGTVASLHGNYSGEGGQYFTLRDFVKLPYAMANGGMVGDRGVLSEEYITDVFATDESKNAAWKNQYMSGIYKPVTRYTNFWYVVDDDTALASGSFGQFNIFNRKTGVAIAKFSTYPKNADAALFTKDVVWLAEQVRSH